jgi:hypothetical protein
MAAYQRLHDLLVLALLALAPAPAMAMVSMQAEEFWFLPVELVSHLCLLILMHVVLRSLDILNKIN